MKVFYLTLMVSLGLIIGGFLVPPLGIIDGSVLSAVGLLLMFAVIAQVSSIINAAHSCKSIKVTKGDFGVEVSGEPTTNSPPPEPFHSQPY